MMKKIISNAVLLLVMTLIGCQNEELVQSQQTGNYALKVGTNFESRTEADEEGNVTWSKGDRMLVYGENVEGVLTLQGEGGESTGTFSGYVFGNPDDLKWAVYPAERSKTTEKGAEINLSKITYPYSNSPMVGEIGDDKNVQLNHLCALIRIPVENVPANAKMTLSSTGISGIAEWDGNALTVTKPTNDIEVEIPTGGNLYVDIPIFATSTETEKTFTLTIDGVSCDFIASVAVKKLTKNANLTFKCTVENGKVTGIAKEETQIEHTSYYLPDGPTFNSIVAAYLQENPNLTKIKFVANSTTTSEDILTTDENGRKGYLVVNGEWLEIHTPAEEFIANGYCAGMFAGKNKEYSPFNSIIEIDFGNQFNTSCVYNMSHMFSFCENLILINLSSFITSNVLDMRTMFQCCKNLVNIDIRHFDTSKVEYFGAMFGHCYSLKTIDVSCFNTSKATDMNSMFYLCKSIESIDVDKFNTSGVTDMGAMFASCEKLKSLNVSNFNTANVVNMKSMFNNCKSLTSIDLENFETSNVTEMSGMFSGCKSLVSIDLENFKTSNVMDMSGIFSRCESLTSIDLANFNTSIVTDIHSMFEGCINLTSVNVSKLNTANVVDMSRMFLSCHKLLSLDIKNFDTSNVTNMWCTFGDCTSIEELDISNLNTSKVTDMRGMFENCTNLTALDLTTFSFSNSPDVGGLLQYIGNKANDKPIKVKVTTDGYNYLTITTNNCGIGGSSKFVKPDGTNWLEEYTSLYLPDGLSFNNIINEILRNNEDVNKIKFITESQTNFGLDSYCDKNGCMAYFTINNEWLEIHTPAKEFIANEDCWLMFSTGIYTGLTGHESLERLTTIDFGSNFNTSNVVNMQDMFSGCSDLKELDLSSFDTSNVTNMTDMFSKCSSLTMLDISNFNTSNVEYMSVMFSNCKSLSSLDLSNFNTSKATSMDNMFASCESLTTINVSGFDTSKVTSMFQMFMNCKNLQSIDVSNFNTSNVTNMGSMFGSCEQLTDLNIENFDTSNVTSMFQMFISCSNLTSIDVSKFNTENVIDFEKMFTGCRRISSLNLSNFSFQQKPKVTSMLQSTGSQIGYGSSSTPIPIKVSEEGYKYLTETTTDCGIGKYAKFVKPDGTDW